MGHMDSCMKQVGSNRIVSLLIAASAVSFVIYLSSDGQETVENRMLKRTFSFHPNSQALDSLAPPASPVHQALDGLAPSASPLRQALDSLAPSASPLHQALHSLAPSASPPHLTLHSLAPSASPPHLALHSLTPSASSLQNTSEIVDYGDKKSISPESWHGNNPTVESDGCKNGSSLSQNRSGENLESYPKHVEEKESRPVHKSQNISEFGEALDRRTYGKVYTVRKNETPPVQCDIYSGKWVRDNSYPLYPAGKCPYMSGAFDCKGNGRPDFGYTQWRWQPKDCNPPRLNATDMLERLRGKRLMFIGDSINRNQWESLLCILRTAVPDNRKHFGFKGDITTFLAKDYNCTVELFWAPFLVEQDSIKAGNNSREILRLDAIEKHGAYWKDVDILVFNTAHWWIHGNKAATRDFFLEGNYLHPQLDPLAAFQKGMTTWAKWIDHNINPTKTRVFFRGISPMHFSSEQWHKSGTHKCNFEREPIFEESVVEAFPVMLQVVDKVLRRMKFPVSLLNITRLSDFRKDAHPSVYTLRRNKKLTQEQRNNPDDFGDCSHWCLPGLPDIWNELLYWSLVNEAG